MPSLKFLFAACVILLASVDAQVVHSTGRMVRMRRRDIKAESYVEASPPALSAHLSPWAQQNAGAANIESDIASAGKLPLGRPDDWNPTARPFGSAGGKMGKMAIRF
ncbi:hypothetical protein RQP46_002715 [Phenoliferia psychrophenolica]